MHNISKKQFVAGILTVAMLALSVPGWAGNSTTQTVTFQVQAINEISVSGNPAPLVVNAATAGSPPNSASDSSTTYALTTNESNKKITVGIDSAMPSGTTLTITLAAPTGATSAGAVTLGTTAQNAVTGISTLNESGKTITYQFSATAAAGVVASQTRTVTLTITS
jgi:hypothetical protein